jgi:hypothetical protein
MLVFPANSWKAGLEPINIQGRGETWESDAAANRHYAARASKPATSHVFDSYE